MLPKVNLLSANPTKWSSTLKQFVGFCRRIVWVCLTILWVGTEKVKVLIVSHHFFHVRKSHEGSLYLLRYDKTVQKGVWDLVYLGAEIHFENLGLNKFKGASKIQSNILKRSFLKRSKLPTNCLSVFDHFVGLALKGFSWVSMKHTRHILAGNYMFKVNNNTRRKPETFAAIVNGWKPLPIVAKPSHVVLVCYCWTYFTPCSSVSVVNFGQVNTGC